MTNNPLLSKSVRKLSELPMLGEKLYANFETDNMSANSFPMKILISVHNFFS